MEKPVLVIMAAGMGSRYGGCKQIDPMDAQGDLIIDFSIYDALRAGFEDIVFLIKRAIEADFREAIGERTARHANVSYAFQELDKLPAGIQPPEGRQKPFGTTHALLCAAEAIGGRPFVAINADDYYGPAAYRLVYDFLCAEHRPGHHALVGYRLANTLTEAGTVTRGVCEVENGYLTHITERYKIARTETGCMDLDGNVPLQEDAPVSMNFWGFQNDMLDALRADFDANIAAGLAANPLKYEALLPTSVQSAIVGDRCTVKVLPTPDRWFGVTYPEDKPKVMASIARCKAEGLYPEKLWS